MGLVLSLSSRTPSFELTLNTLVIHVLSVECSLATGLASRGSAQQIECNLERFKFFLAKTIKVTPTRNTYLNKFSFIPLITMQLNERMRSN